MGGGLRCPHPVTGRNVPLWGEQRSQLCPRESWAEAFCALRCLKHLSRTFLGVPVPGSSGVRYSAPRHRKLLCRSVCHCVLAAPRHCLVLASLSCQSPPALSRTCCQRWGAAPGPLSRPPAGCPLHSGTQMFPQHLPQTYMLLGPKGQSDPWCGIAPAVPPAPDWPSVRGGVLQSPGPV